MNIDPTTVFSTDHWALILPDGWVYQKQEDPGPYFESPDSSVGLYIRVIRKNPNIELMNDLDWLNSIMAIQERSLLSMPNSSFIVLKQQVLTEAKGTIGFLEGLDEGANYRISCLHFLRSLLCITVNLHDYHCTNLVKSRSMEGALLAGFKAMA